MAVVVNLVLQLFCLWIILRILQRRHRGTHLFCHAELVVHLLQLSDVASRGFLFGFDVCQLLPTCLCLFTHSFLLLLESPLVFSVSGACLCLSLSFRQCLRFLLCGFRGTLGFVSGFLLVLRDCLGTSLDALLNLLDIPANSTVLRTIVVDTFEIIRPTLLGQQRLLREVGVFPKLCEGFPRCFDVGNLLLPCGLRKFDALLPLAVRRFHELVVVLLCLRESAKVFFLLRFEGTSFESLLHILVIGFESTQARHCIFDAVDFNLRRQPILHHLRKVVNGFLRNTELFSVGLQRSIRTLRCHLNTLDALRTFRCFLRKIAIGNFQIALRDFAETTLHAIEFLTNLSDFLLQPCAIKGNLFVPDFPDGLPQTVNVFREGLNGFLCIPLVDLYGVNKFSILCQNSSHSHH